VVEERLKQPNKQTNIDASNVLDKLMFELVLELVMMREKHMHASQ